MTRSFTTASTAVLLLTSACGAVADKGALGAGRGQGASCPAGMTRHVQDRLYMGAGTHKAWVSPEEFEHFLDQVVTPRFPQGFTVMRSAGQWRHPDGSVTKEPSWLLTILHEANSGKDAAVDQIAAAYKSGFGQEAVLRVRSVVCASFISASANSGAPTSAPPPAAQPVPSREQGAITRPAVQPSFGVK